MSSGHKTKDGGIYMWREINPNKKREFDSVLKHTSLKNFLKASAYASGERSPLEKRLSGDVYYRYLYANSEDADNYVNDIMNRIQYDDARNIVLSGYKGCGKTTFIHYLIRQMSIRRIVLNFDVLVDYGSEIKTVLVQYAFDQIFDDIIIKNSEITEKFLEIYMESENLRSFGRCFDIDNKFLYLFRKLIYAKDKSKEWNEKQYSEKYLIEDVKIYLGEFDVNRLMILIVMWDTAYRIRLNCENECLIIFDNIDTIYNTTRLPEFIQQIALFRNNIDRIFEALRFQGESMGDPSQDYICVFVMRETTKAEFADHFLDQKVSLYVPRKSMSFLYDMLSIVHKRKDYLRLLKEENAEIDSHCLQLLNETQRLEILLDDPYVRTDVLGLFNHDFRTSFEVLAELNFMDEKFYQSCDNLRRLDKDNSWSKYGSRCILFREIYNLLGETGYFEYMKRSEFQITVGDKTYAANLDRIILLYLSNSQNIYAADEERELEFVELNTLFRDLLRFCNNDTAIVNSIWDMYEMRRKQYWNHLVTFDEMRDVTRDELMRQIDCTKKGEQIKYGKIRITTAGRNYLEIMLPHFEYFAARVYGKMKPSLFSFTAEELMDINNVTSYIREVRNEAVICCSRLMVFYQEVFAPIIDFQGENFLKSKFAWHKLTESQTLIRMFHCERIVHSQIGYLDAVRMYAFYRLDEIENRGYVNKNVDITVSIKEAAKLCGESLLFKDTALKRNDVNKVILLSKGDKSSNVDESDKIEVLCQFADGTSAKIEANLHDVITTVKISLNCRLVNQIRDYIKMFGIKSNKNKCAMFSKSTEFLVACYECCIDDVIVPSAYSNFEFPIDRKNGEPLLRKHKKVQNM